MFIGAFVNLFCFVCTTLYFSIKVNTYSTSEFGFIVFNSDITRVGAVKV